MKTVYLGIDSNLGDRIGYIQQAVKMLEDNGVVLLETSSFYETEPFGKKDQPWFINTVVKIKTNLNPYELLKICQKIEDKLGRIRNTKWGERVIDIDILLYENEIIETQELSIPHISTYNRSCTLVPLLEVAEEVIHPVLKKTIDEIYQKLQMPGEVYLYGTKPNI